MQIGNQVANEINNYGKLDIGTQEVIKKDVKAENNDVKEIKEISQMPIEELAKEIVKNKELFLIFWNKNSTRAFVGNTEEEIIEFLSKKLSDESLLVFKVEEEGAIIHFSFEDGSFVTGGSGFYNVYQRIGDNFHSIKQFGVWMF